MAARRRSQADTILDDVFAMLLVLPWWGGPVLAGGVYALLTWGFPWVFSLTATDSPVSQLPQMVIPKVSIMLAPWVALMILVMGVVATAKRWSNRRLLDAQTGTASIRQLNWQEFERLLGEAFRREGYQVEHVGGTRPDGGVDLRLRREQRVDLVQCKHWKEFKVGVKVVRELLGVVASQLADGGVVVTSGEFTNEAQDFARTTSIRLIGGDELLQMIRGVQRSPRVESPAQAPSRTPLAPACPKCGSGMVLRIARQGANAGNHFWGCSDYPRCKGIVNVRA